MKDLISEDIMNFVFTDIFIYAEIAEKIANLN